MPLKLTATKSELICDKCGVTYRRGDRDTISNNNVVGTFETKKPSLCKPCRFNDPSRTSLGGAKRGAKIQGTIAPLPKPKGLATR